MNIELIPTISDPNIEPYFDNSIDANLLIKNHLLIGKKEDVLFAFLNKEHIVEGLSYLSKLSLKIDNIAFLDEDSYERLYLKFAEQKKDYDINSSISIDDDEDLLDDNVSLSEFLKTNLDILTTEESAPVIKFVNSLFYQAVKRKASDIHIETHEKKGIIRFRIDGVLIKHVEVEKRVVDLIINRIKVISSLDISEKRIPQDGRTVIKISKKNLDIRVSILPTYYGERVVLRILMDSSHIPSLKQLGFDESLTKQFKKLLTHSYGMILSTGPTGSGKSTTLHSFLKTIATPEKNIITIEDPVEYKTEQISQIQVNPKTGLTFASGLRSILRQDPDIIMVGEIRDNETAKIAVQAALTGHLVLSTLHTNNTTAAITRLMDMGIEEFLISSSLLGVLAQRLVRKLCDNCKKKIGEYYVAQGCKECNYTGYKGRTAVGELFLLDDEAKIMIKNGLKDFEIREAMQKKGLVTLNEKIEELVLKGITSIQEALRVGLRD